MLFFLLFVFLQGTVQFDKDGCCQICETSNCVRVKNVTRLHVKDCISIKDVEVASCTGHCDDRSRYSMEKNTMMHNCSCCQEEKFSHQQVKLKCADNSEILYDYIYVESCRCTPTKCEEYTEKLEDNMEREDKGHNRRHHDKYRWKNDFNGWH